MNDDIKEFNEEIYVEMLENGELYDYITNLQQELEEYKDTETYSKRFLYKANKDRLNANLELVKENERLKKQVKIEVEVRDYEVSLKEDYKSRIEKAVEYLKNNCYIGNCINTYEAIDIINVMDILNGKGSDK